MRKTITAWSACAAAILPALAATGASADTPVTPAGALQLAGQAAASQQAATSAATSTQDHPTNTAIQVAILSPGASSGPVSQANTSNATSAAGNTNATTQNANQAGDGSGGAQAVGQEAKSRQAATSTATSTQDHPANTAIHVAILSPGASSGPVHQQNASNASSQAGNTNTTNQNATQASGGGGGVQAVGQAAASAQKADSTATSKQDHPSNTAIDVAILSPSHDRYAADGSAKAPEVAAAPSAGSVSQANTSNATSAAGNTNGTTQNATQQGGAGASAPLARSVCETCGDDGASGIPGIQAAGQLAINEQAATSTATSQQVCPANLAFGATGRVDQANTSNANSAAGNTNRTAQSVWQGFGFLKPVMLA